MLPALEKGLVPPLGDLERVDQDDGFSLMRIVSFCLRNG